MVTPAGKGSLLSQLQEKDQSPKSSRLGRPGQGFGNEAQESERTGVNQPK